MLFVPDVAYLVEFVGYLIEDDGCDTQVAGFESEAAVGC